VLEIVAVSVAPFDRPRRRAAVVDALIKVFFVGGHRVVVSQAARDAILEALATFEVSPAGLAAELIDDQ
jgi:hypothetical protein